jgi:glutamyl/glutaminyl-tRNA synthetase
VSQQHLTALDDAAYHDAASAYLAHYQPEFHARPELIQLTRGKVRLFNEIPEYVRQWLPDAVIGYDDAELISKVTSNPLVIEHWPAMAEGLKSTPMDAVDFLKQYAESHSLNLGKLMLPLRYTLSAQKSGPDLLPAISLLGAAAAGERMENFSKQFIQAAQA